VAAGALEFRAVVRERARVAVEVPPGSNCRRFTKMEATMQLPWLLASSTSAM